MTQSRRRQRVDGHHPPQGEEVPAGKTSEDIKSWHQQAEGLVSPRGCTSMTKVISSCIL